MGLEKFFKSLIGRRNSDESVAFAPPTLPVEAAPPSAKPSTAPDRKTGATQAAPQQARCQICGNAALLLDTVDFNKSCEEPRGLLLPRSGIPVDYYLCDHCGFCFAPEFESWSFEDFEKRIYNQDYETVDPDYKFVRPNGNADSLEKTFGFCKGSIRHLDYGGGSGLLSKTLRQHGWTSETYDPFVDRDKNPGDLGQFDLITAFEVFEHVPDISHLIDTLKKLCKPDGVVLFSTLLSDGNIARSSKLTWWYASPRNGHISLFSRKSLELTMSQRGLQFVSLNDNAHVAFFHAPQWFVQAMQGGGATASQPSTESASDLLQAAVDLHKQGNLDGAEALYLDLLQRDARNADALQYLGMLNGQRGQHGKAVEYFQQALAISPQHFAALSNFGNTLMALGRHEQALEQFKLALAARPEHAQLWFNQGNALLRLGQAADACESYRRAVNLNPDFLDAHIVLATTQRELGQLDGAVAGFRKVLAMRPDFAEVHASLASALNALGQREDAVACYQKAAEIKPDFAEAHANLGSVFNELGRFEEAAASLRKALTIKPDFAEAHSNLGLALKNLGQLEEALASCRRALEIKPDYATAHINLGNALHALGQCEASMASCRRALEIQPDYAEAHNNLGLLLAETGRRDEAEAAYRRALEIKPEYTEAAWNLSLLLLAQGRYLEAWPLHEARYDPSKKESSTKAPALPYPQWRGESLAGKSLLLWPEQGFGDYIQFVRYAALLKELGVSRLTLFCAPPLKPLLETVEGVDAVVTDGEPIAPHDYWAFPLSLPLRFATTIDNMPDALPYLHALPQRLERWQTRLPGKDFKVGLVWKGNPSHKNDAHRSLPGLCTLAPLWSVPGVTFVSLQKWQAEDEAAASPHEQPLIDLGTDIADFADTAAIVAQLDLVICVDTAIAHVAGAMGKPCWVLLPSFGTDWRWLLERPDTPWYPRTMRLFRQAQRGDWNGTIGEVTEALRQIAIEG